MALLYSSCKRDRDMASRKSSQMISSRKTPRFLHWLFLRLMSISNCSRSLFSSADEAKKIWMVFILYHRLLRLKESALFDERLTIFAASQDSFRVTLTVETLT